MSLSPAPCPTVPLLTRLHSPTLFCFFFNDTATTEIYTLSLHDALPIFIAFVRPCPSICRGTRYWRAMRSEEHTSELQSRLHLVCRLLLEKKKLLPRPSPGS